MRRRNAAVAMMMEGARRRAFKTADFFSYLL
jgi:hypothetical protein